MKVDEQVVEIGIDGDCAYALLGEDLHVGESVFVHVKGELTPETAFDACILAYQRLCYRFKRRLPYRFDDSYPAEAKRVMERDGKDKTSS